MAITRRLTPEDERALARLAEAEGLSKRETAALAIHQAAARRESSDKVTALSAAARGRYAALLDRLAQ